MSAGTSPLALIIDDEPQIRRLLRTLLEADGYRVAEAPTGDGGLIAAAQKPPDVVLLDLGLPDQDGLTVLRRLREWTPVPVLILSDEPAHDRRRALLQGISDLLAAPFDSEELLLTLRLALQRSAERRRDSRSLRGSLALLPLVDLLQTLEAGHRTGVVDIRSGPRRATLWLNQGQPVDAEIDDGRRAEEAVYALLRFEEGSFEVLFDDVSVPRRISTSMSGLLLEGLRRIDESARDEAIPHAALPDPPPLPPREAMAAHRALTLLNVAGAYASSFVQTPLLVAAFDEARRALWPELPELAFFETSATGQISLKAGSDAVPVDRLVLAAATWAQRVFLRLERALPGQFGNARLLSLTEAVREDMRSLGFDDVLASEHSPLEES